MERLTKYGETSHENGVCCTHFGSKECHEVAGNCAYDCKWEEEAWSKLAHYEDLEEQGLLMKLPCKVGDVVYRVNQYAKEPIISMRISRIELVESLGGYSNFSIETINNEDKGEAYYYRREIGKVVFLTKAEAEKALEEMEK